MPCSPLLQRDACRVPSLCVAARGEPFRIGPGASSIGLPPQQQFITHASEEARFGQIGKRHQRFLDQHLIVQAKPQRTHLLTLAVGSEQRFGQIHHRLDLLVLAALDGYLQWLLQTQCNAVALTLPDRWLNHGLHRFDLPGLVDRNPKLSSA